MDDLLREEEEEVKREAASKASTAAKNKKRKNKKKGVVGACICVCVHVCLKKRQRVCAPVSACLWNCLIASVCVSIYLSVYLSGCWSICLYIFPSVWLSVSASMCVYMCMRMSAQLTSHTKTSLSDAHTHIANTHTWLTHLKSFTRRPFLWHTMSFFLPPSRYFTLALPTSLACRCHQLPSLSLQLPFSASVPISLSLSPSPLPPPPSLSLSPPLQSPSLLFQSPIQTTIPTQTHSSKQHQKQQQSSVISTTNCEHRIPTPLSPLPPRLELLAEKIVMMVNGKHLRKTKCRFLKMQRQAILKWTRALLPTPPTQASQISILLPQPQPPPPLSWTYTPSISINILEWILPATPLWIALPTDFLLVLLDKTRYRVTLRGKYWMERRCLLLISALGPPTSGRFLSIYGSFWKLGCPSACSSDWLSVYEGIHAYVNICINTFIYVCIYMCIYIHICLYIYVYVYVHIFMHIYIYIHRYIDLSIYIYVYVSATWSWHVRWHVADTFAYIYKNKPPHSGGYEVRCLEHLRVFM